MYPVLKKIHMLNFLNTFSVGVSKTLDSGDPAPTNFKMAYT